MRLPMSRIVSILLLVPLLAVLDLSSAASASAARPTGHDLPASLLNGVSTGPAKQALADAEHALAGTSVGTRNVTGGHFDVTAALANLRAHLAGLHGADRERAEQLLARPTVPGGDYLGPDTVVRLQAARAHAYGTKHFVVHYVTSGKNRARKAWVRRTARVLEHVWAVEIGRLGFRHPKPDAKGRAGRVDVYLAQIGSKGYYGYCAPDHSTRTSSGYCVLDNNFSRREFHTKPVKALRVTAAHEFFHDIQFNYRNALQNWLWFAEGTAVWMEDRVYDGINDYLQYLPASPIRKPRTPFTSNKLYHRYGAFAIFTFLGARYHDGGFVRKMWNGVARGISPIKAMRRVAASHHATMKGVARNFGVWNTLRKHTYPERKLYFPAGWWKTRKLTRSRHSTGWKGVRVRGFATAPLRVRRGHGIAKKRKRAVINVDAPGRKHNPAVDVQIRFRNGKVRTRTIRLNGAGNAKKVVAFGKRVKYVIVTLTNGSNGHGRKFRVRVHLR